MASDAHVTQRTWSQTARFFLVMGGVILTVAGLRAGSKILGPLLFAIFLTLLANPALNWFRSKSVPSWLALLMLAISTVVVGAAMLLFVASSLNSLQANIPQYEHSPAKYFESLKTYLSGVGVDASNIKLSESLKPKAVANLLGKLIAYLFSQLSVVALALLLFIFLLTEASVFPVKAIKAFGENSPIVLRLGSFGNAVVTYTKIRTLANLFVAFAWGSLLLFLGVDGAFLWAFLAFILQYIPTIGLIIAMVPAVFIALLDEGPATAGIVLVGLFVINSIGVNLIVRRYSAKQLALAPSVAFFSFVFWAWVFGTIGGILSVVITVGMKSVLEGYPESKGLALLLGPAPPTEEPAD